MKNLVLLFVFCVSALTLSRAVEPEGVTITKEEAQSIASYDLEKIRTKGPALAGQLVKLKFNYRSAAIEKTPDGKLSGHLRIWRASTAAVGSTYKYAGLAVTIPPEGMDWFMKIPTRDDSRPTLILIARIGDGIDQPAAILGREIKTDIKGSHVVW